MCIVDLLSDNICAVIFSLCPLPQSAYAAISTIGSIRLSVVCLQFFFARASRVFIVLFCCRSVLNAVKASECRSSTQLLFGSTCMPTIRRKMAPTIEYTLLLSNKNTNRDEHKTVINDYVVRCAIRFVSAQICRFNKNQIRVNRICSKFSVLVSAPVNGCVVLTRH